MWFSVGWRVQTRKAVVVGNIVEKGDLIEDVVKLNTGYGINSELGLL